MFKPSANDFVPSIPIALRAIIIAKWTNNLLISAIIHEN